MGRVEASTEEDSYTIFEILNARGQSLADHELLKNYVMRYVKPKENVDYIKKEWEDMEKKIGKGIEKYLLHYLIHKYRIDDIDKRNPYKTFKKNVKINEINSFFTDFLLKLKASYYSKIYSPIITDGDGNLICTELEHYKQSSFKGVQTFVERYGEKINSYNIDSRRKHLAEIFYKSLNA